MMTRKDCYDFIKKHNLSDEVKNKLGRHYTNVTTENLLNYVASKTAKKVTKKNTKEDCMCNTIHNKFAKLVEILGKHRILLPSEIDDICKS